MTSMPLNQMRDNLLGLIERVKQGETVVITEDDHPVAQLTPAPARQSTANGWEARRQRLERQGLLRRGTGSLEWLLREPAPGPREGAGVLRALLEERQEGR